MQRMTGVPAATVLNQSVVYLNYKGSTVMARKTKLDTNFRHRITKHPLLPNLNLAQPRSSFQKKNL